MKKNPLRKYFLSVYNFSSNDDVINYLAIFYQENLNRISTMRNPKSRLGKCLILLGLLLTFLETEGVSVEITYLNDAVAKGAVCLDGSPPAYHFDRGSGAGSNNWLIHIEGGAWCHNVESCFDRKHTSLGSSKIMQKHMNFSGILSNRQQSNPDFYNWNRIKVRYCDGSSFTGDVENVDPTTNLYFRGARVWLAVMEDLLAKGMKNAENAILSGCSAGGLTSVLHCDNFRSLLPTHAKVKCVSDAGFFIHTKDISGVISIEAFYNGVVATHGSVNHLPQSCTARMKPELCFFPQYAAHRMQTPLFIINSAYDSWQMQNILVPRAADPHMEWLNCKRDLNNCTVSQFKTIQDFRQQFLSALSELCNSSSRGMFIDSCYTHCQTESQNKWLSNVSPLVQNTPISKAVGDWFYERGAPNQLVDCPYPCNPTCHRNSSHVLQEPELQILAGDKDYLEVS